MPPATNITFDDKGDALLEVSQGADFVTHSLCSRCLCSPCMCQKDFDAHSVVNVCAMHEWEYGDRCLNPTIEGSDFCAEHMGVKLCKTSGLQYQFEGNASWMLETMPHHPVDTNHLWGGPRRTKRAEFCGDRKDSRCRNLWRDTKQSRERQTEVAKLENGERSERYALISNFRNSGKKVIVDKQTNRVVG